MKSTKSKIFAIISVITVFSIPIIFSIMGYYNDKYFINNSINKRIYRIHNEQDKFFRYFYDKSHYITSYMILPVVELRVGDSISKSINTGKFKIYRKTSIGVFSQIGEYEYRPDYAPWLNKKNRPAGL